MSRPRLSDDSPTVMRRYRVPATLAATFAEHCKSLGYSVSDRLRQLMECDLRNLSEIVRLKRKERQSG